jgi:hypothetical protein
MLPAVILEEGLSIMLYVVKGERGILTREEDLNRKSIYTLQISKEEECDKTTTGSNILIRSPQTHLEYFAWLS